MTDSSLRLEVTALVAVLMVTCQSTIAFSSTLEVPLPNGKSLRFRQIFLGLPPDVIPSREYVAGDRSENNPTEPLVPVRIGGAFLERAPSGNLDWCFYLAESEVTESQWNAVMGGGEPSNGSIPKTGVSYLQVLEFLNQCNLWIYENARDSFPSNDESLGFLRLPTEHEWEFAARGGIEVLPEQFDRQIPYSGPDELRRHEWLFGSDSSSGKVKPVARSKGPNPLGLFDMFGNASELTASHFSVDPNSGRVGGMVVKGGDVRTSLEKAHSGMRTEFSLYTPNGTQNSGELVGFRPVIASNIITSVSTIPKIAMTKDSTSAVQIPLAAAGQAMQSSSAATSEELEKARGRLVTLERQISQLSQTAVQSDALQTELLLMRKGLDTAQLLIDKRNQEIAQKSVRLASRFASQFGIASRRLLLIDPVKLGLNDLETRVVIDKMPVWKRDVASTWTGLLEELSSLSEIDRAFKAGFNSESHVDNAFRLFRQEIPAENLIQKAELEVVEDLVENFRPGMSPEPKPVFDRLDKAGEPHRIK